MVKSIRTSSIIEKGLIITKWEQKKNNGDFKKNKKLLKVKAVK